MRKRCAIIPSTGVGDALLMMVAAHALKSQGYAVTLYHPTFPQLSPWFPGHDLQSSYDLSDLPTFDLIIAQNNNGPHIQSLLTLRPHLKRLSIFYPTYKPTKHAPLSPDDHPFDPNLTMVQNIVRATASPTTHNGITPLPGLCHRKHPKRVVLQPFSQNSTRSWLPSRFLKLAKKLKKRGYEPTFALTLDQKKHSLFSTIDTPHFDTLSDLTAYIYESGYLIGNDSLLPHLASNLNIPHMTIAHNPVHMHLWQPGWHPGTLLLPPRHIPNLKFLRLRNRHWARFITTNAALRAFHGLL